MSFITANLTNLDVRLKTPEHDIYEYSFINKDEISQVHLVTNTADNKCVRYLIIVLKNGQTLFTYNSDAETIDSILEDLRSMIS
jgi:hypothetical protein